jgi:cytoskeleton protein RodZ
MAQPSATARCGSLRVPAICAIAEAPKIEPAKIEPAKVEPAKVEPPPRNEPPKAAARIEPPKAEPAKVERVAATASGSTLKFRFAGKSWVEIKDGSGKVLMTGLNDSGSEAEVVGKPPLRVTVGNAPEVRMFVNDREFDLAPHMREAVARFTVE